MGIEKNMLFPILLMEFYEYKSIAFNLDDKGDLFVCVNIPMDKSRKNTLYEKHDLSLTPELNELALDFLNLNKEKRMLNFTEKGFKFFFSVDNVAHENKKIIFHWILGSYQANKKNIDKLLFVEKIEQSLTEKAQPFINKKKL